MLARCPEKKSVSLLLRYRQAAWIAGQRGDHAGLAMSGFVAKDACSDFHSVAGTSSGFRTGRYTKHLALLFGGNSHTTYRLRQKRKMIGTRLMSSKFSV